MKRMEERDMKGKDLRQLYRKFNDEMERVELPSGNELRQLIGERGAEKKPSAPYIPLSRPKPVLRYAMAAMLVLALGVGVWMVERRQSGPSMAASRPEKPAAVADTAALPIADSIEPTAIDKPQVQQERLASNPMPETDKTRVQVAADSASTVTITVHRIELLDINAIEYLSDDAPINHILAFQYRHPHEMEFRTSHIILISNPNHVWVAIVG